MNRENAKWEIKRRYAEYLQPAKKIISGQQSYICPLCGNGKGSDGTGMTIDPHGDGTQLHCFVCHFHGDIIDLYQEVHHCDFNTAFEALCDYFNIIIDDDGGALAWNDAITDDGDQKTSAEPTEKPDFTDYYKECKNHIGDDRAQAYLAFRGLSNETAARFWIGYDSATGFMIIPAANSFYIARNTDHAAKMRYKNPAGANIELFNKKALYNEADRPVFITEGAIDALSIIEAGGEAVALNSASNVRKLIEQLKEKHCTNTLILCLDEDDAGKKAQDQLAEGLCDLNIPYVLADVCGEYKDPNEALTSDKDAFLEAVTTAIKQTQYPGLLTPARAIATLEAVDDHYLDLPNFPQLASTLKLKTHDTVVIAADTGAGKSSLSLNLLHDLQDRYPALYINLEMDAATVLQRLIAIHTGIELDAIERYKQDESIRSKANAAIREITARKEIQLLEDVYDLRAIEAYIQAATRYREEPTIVFIDTGLLVTLPNKNVSRYERFTQISEELRRISRLNNVIMFVLLQQSRDGKKEDQKAPANSSLKESGSWENDATKIMFLWNNPQTQKKELAITKNRSGKIGSVPLAYYPHTQTYKEEKGVFISFELPAEWANAPRK